MNEFSLAPQKPSVTNQLRSGLVDVLMYHNWNAGTLVRWYTQRTGLQGILFLSRGGLN